LEWEEQDVQKGRQRKCRGGIDGGKPLIIKQRFWDEMADPPRKKNFGEKGVFYPDSRFLGGEGNALNDKGG